MTSHDEMVRECLNGSTEARTVLVQETRPTIVSNLIEGGATHSHAEVIADGVLNDCFKPGEQSLLRRFDGKRDLRIWLSRVAINRFLDVSLIEKVLGLAGLTGDLVPAQGRATDHFTEMLRSIVRKGLNEALDSFEPQVSVLLKLKYRYGVEPGQLAKAWRRRNEDDIALTISSHLDALRAGMSRAILRIDPALSILWDHVRDSFDES